MTRKRWRDPDKRMNRAVELRRQGWSLRRIGAELAVGEATIRRDLARHRQEQERAEPARPQLRVVTPAAPSVRHPHAPLAPDDAPEWRRNDAEGEAG